MLKAQISKEKTDMLALEITEHMSQEDLQAGLELQQKGFVFNATVEEETFLTAKVQETLPFPAVYRVKIPLDTFSLSTCSCSSPSICSHIAAAFFYLYTNYGHPDQLVRNMRKKNREHAIPSQSISPPLHTETEIAWDTTVKESDLPSEWNTIITQQYEQIASRKRIHGFPRNEFFYGMYDQLFQPAQWWPSALSHLYKFHVATIILMKIEEMLPHHTNETMYKFGSIKPIHQYFSDQLIALSQKIDANTLSDTYSTYRQETIDWIHYISFRENQTPVPWLYIYYSLWDTMLSVPSWREVEMSYLEKQIEDHEISGRTKDLYILARAHFYIVDEKDEGAQKLLQQMKTFTINDLVESLNLLLRNREWERLIDWLRWLLPFIQSTSADHFHTYNAFWMEVCKQRGSMQEWEQLMTSLLPRSYYVYTEYLLKNHLYKQWVNVQLAFQLSPTELSSVELRTIEKEDPAMLLPIYHQSIEREIERKQRNAYKIAVRLLKKLHSLYKALDRPEDFEVFIIRLQAHYNRLRTFHNELKKGNLLR